LFTNIKNVSDTTHNLIVVQKVIQIVLKNNFLLMWATGYVRFHLNSTYVFMIVNISLYAE